MFPCCTAAPGATLAIPYLGKAAAASRSELSLLELEGDAYVTDHFDRLAVRDGLVELRTCRRATMTSAAQGDGRSRAGPSCRERCGDGFLLGSSGCSKCPPWRPCRSPVSRPKTTNSSSRCVTHRRSRVHVFSNTHMEPAYSPFDRLSPSPAADSTRSIPDPPNPYYS